MDFKIFIPFENYTLASTLSMEEVKKRLSESIEPKKTSNFSFFPSYSLKPYSGQITGDNFEMVRIIRYKNSFLPFITGKISSNFGQTLIKIKMRPNIFVLIFIGYWLWFFGPMCFGFILRILPFKNNAPTHFSYDMLIPFGMILFVWLLALLGFKSESRKSKEFLEVLLNGEETKAYEMDRFG